jgi:ribonuclease Y
MSFLTKLSKIFGAPPKEQVREHPRVLKKVVKKLIRPPTPVAVPSRELEEAKNRAREIIFEARDEALRIKAEADDQARRIQSEIGRKIGTLEEKERLTAEKSKQLEQKAKEVENIKQQQLEKLERAGHLTAQEAKNLILEASEKKLTAEIARQIRETEERAKQEADQKAKEILVEAMQRGATDYVPEYTVSAVKLTDEEMKGRIIGREGRNIRTFEKTTGVDVDLDEEGVIRLSCFDPIRREVARVTLEKLITDGRIQPSRIEEIVDRTQKDINRIIQQAGEDLCHRVRVYNLPLEVVKMLGRFKYRFSYGQNMIAHTLEETKIGIHLAYETKANVNVVRLGCLLHDIGKVITEEEGSHVQVGVDFLRKYSIPQQVLDCVAQHHEDEQFTSVEAVLVYIADAISGSRPGARYEDYEEYVARMKKLEDLAKSFKGVDSAYAIQAGREVRVIVNPKEIDDASSIKLATDLKEKVQKELTFPGQVKVTVIRETRAIEVAK